MPAARAGTATGSTGSAGRGTAGRRRRGAAPRCCRVRRRGRSAPAGRLSAGVALLAIGVDVGDDHRVAAVADQVDARGVPERLRDRAGERSTSQVRGRSCTSRRRRRGGAACGLPAAPPGEQVALQPHLAAARDQRERVGQGENDQVVGAVRTFQQRPAVVDVHVDPGVVVRVVGVVLTPELQQPRVDLDGVDTRRAALQRDSHVDAVAGADDEDVARAGPRHPHIGQRVRRRRTQPGRQGRDGLVRDPVHAHVHPRQASERALLRGHLVVRRPRHPRGEALQGEDADEHDERGGDERGGTRPDGVAGASSTPVRTATTAPQATEGARRNDSSVKPEMPTRLPIRS